MDPQADFAHRCRVDALATADGDNGIDQRVQDDAARVGLMAIGLDQPALAEAGDQAFRRRGVAVHAAESLLTLDDFLRAVETAFCQQRRQNAILGRFPGVERLAHGAAVLLHAGRLGGANAHRAGELLRIESDQLAGRHRCRNGAERAGEVPPAFVMAGRREAAANAGLEPRRIGKHQISPAHACALGKCEQCGQNWRARMQNDAAHVRIIEIKHMAHLAVGKRRIGEPKLEVSAQHGRLWPAACLLEHCKQRIDRFVPAPRERTASPVEHAATGLALRRRRKIGIPGCREMRAQGFGESCGSGIEIPVHCRCRSLDVRFQTSI